MILIAQLYKLFSIRSKTEKEKLSYNFFFFFFFFSERKLRSLVDLMI